MNLLTDTRDSRRLRRRRWDDKDQDLTVVDAVYYTAETASLQPKGHGPGPHKTYQTYPNDDEPDSCIAEGPILQKNAPNSNRTYHIYPNDDKPEPFIVQLEPNAAGSNKTYGPYRKEDEADSYMSQLKLKGHDSSKTHQPYRPMSGLPLRIELDEPLTASPPIPTGTSCSSDVEIRRLSANELAHEELFPASSLALRKGDGQQKWAGHHHRKKSFRFTQSLVSVAEESCISRSLQRPT